MHMQRRLGPTGRIAGYTFTFDGGLDGHSMRIQQVLLVAKALTNATPTNLRDEVSEGTLKMLAGLSLQLAGLLEGWWPDHKLRAYASKALRDVHLYLLQKRQQLVDGGEVESVAEFSMTGDYDYFGHDWTSSTGSLGGAD